MEQAIRLNEIEDLPLHQNIAGTQITTRSISMGT